MVGTAIIMVGIPFGLSYITFKLDKVHSVFKIFLLFAVFFMMIYSVDLARLIAVEEANHTPASADAVINHLTHCTSLMVWITIMFVTLFMLYYLFILFLWVGSIVSPNIKKWSENKGFIK